MPEFAKRDVDNNISVNFWTNDYYMKTLKEVNGVDVETLFNHNAEKIITSLLQRDKKNMDIYLGFVVVGDPHGFLPTSYVKVVIDDIVYDNTK